MDGYPGGTLDFQDKNLNDLSEEEKIALLGKPKLGESTRSQIRIKESKEFKVSFLHYVIVVHLQRKAVTPKQ